MARECWHLQAGDYSQFLRCANENGNSLVLPWISLGNVCVLNVHMVLVHISGGIFMFAITAIVINTNLIIAHHQKIPHHSSSYANVREKFIQFTHFIEMHTLNIAICFDFYVDVDFVVNRNGAHE